MITYLNDFILKYPGYPDLRVHVPCSVYSALLEHGLIEDPYYRMNAGKLLDFSDADCVFETSFSVRQEELDRRRLELRFEGLDTLCEVYLNGLKIGCADNMHRTWVFSAKGAAVSGVNHLELRFSSPLRYMREKQSRHDAWGDTHAIDGIAHIRKASYMFGWDWYAKLPDIGIFRRVMLCVYDEPVLEELEILQYHRDGRVELDLRCRTDVLPDGVELRAVLACPDGTELPFAVSGMCGSLTVEHPQLWWPNGYGGQPLYEVRAELISGGTVLDCVRRKIGLRTVTVSRERDRWGREFCFVVNGVKIFAMGADYVPEDGLLSRVTPERSERLIRSCAEANFNMLRIWGGGYYPSDEFYDLCDRYGILLWQDFMFACLNVYLTPAFEQNVRAEMTDVLRRIRHHACLGMLCGNNEMEFAVCEWSIPKDALVRRHYLRLYEEIMPQLCEQMAPQLFYWPSSPSSGGGFDRANDENDGDAHFWEVWNRNAPICEYRKHFFRFCSEFGFQAFPDIRTLRDYTGEAHPNPLSEVVEFHQKREQASVRLVSYAAEEFLLPRDTETFVYATQLMQGMAIQSAVEHFRRHRGRCMGAVYWQLNDCWPAQSWSSIDYYGRYKALHYFAKRFFQPVLLSLHPEGEETVVSISNETMLPFLGHIELLVVDAELRIHHQERHACRVPTLSALDAARIRHLSWIQGEAHSRLLVCRLYGRGGELLAERTQIYTKQKYFRYRDPALQCRVEEADGRFVIWVRGTAFASGVEIHSDRFDLVLSDNYFDLTSDMWRRIDVMHPLPGVSREALLASLTLRSVYSIGRNVQAVAEAQESDPCQLAASNPQTVDQSKGFRQFN